MVYHLFYHLLLKAFHLNTFSVLNEAGVYTMSRFGYILTTYIFYVAVNLAINAWYTVEGKPVMALGFLTRWWVFLIIFLIAYASEWIALLLSKEE